MNNVNEATLIGRLGQQPEIRYTQNNTAVATLSVATSKKYKRNNGEKVEKTEWHRVIAWGKLAQIVEQYFGKGDLVYVKGEIQTNQWEDKNGQKRYTTEINASTALILSSPNPNNSRASQSNGDVTRPWHDNSKTPETANADTGGIPPAGKDEDDENLPF